MCAIPNILLLSDMRAIFCLILLTADGYNAVGAIKTSPIVFSPSNPDVKVSLRSISLTLSILHGAKSRNYQESTKCHSSNSKYGRNSSADHHLSIYMYQFYLLDDVILY